MALLSPHRGKNGPSDGRRNSNRKDPTVAGTATATTAATTATKTQGSSCSALNSIDKNSNDDDDDRFFQQRLPPSRIFYESSSSSSSNDKMLVEPKVAINRPTQTLPDTNRLSSGVAKPKIVILGATGRIGRLVIRRLMDLSIDLTVVAIVRNLDKAVDVLYNDNNINSNGRKKKQNNNNNSMVLSGPKGGPELQIVVSDLVPPNEVYGYRPEDDEDEDDDIEHDCIWNKRVLGQQKQRSSLFGTNNNNNNNNNEQEDDKVLFGRFCGNITHASKHSHHNEALASAIQGSSAIISCVGTVRVTNPLTDFCFAPWRIFRRRASAWCSDPTHPYYVNYWTTVKALAYAERDQRRREAQWEQARNDERLLAKDAQKRGYHWRTEEDIATEESRPEKIRFVRISDLCVGNPPWGLVTVLTNLFRSMVFRHQESSEHLLEHTSVIDTVVLRPGDLTDDQRNENTTSLQVDTSGFLPSPSMVSRDDVAAMAVAAALTRRDGSNLAEAPTRRKKDTTTTYYMPESVTIKTSRKWRGVEPSPSLKQQQQQQQQEQEQNYIQEENENDDEGRHIIVAMRWAADHLSQGCKTDGFRNAQQCMNKILKEKAISNKKTNNNNKTMKRKTFQKRINSPPAEVITSTTTKSKSTKKNLLQQMRGRKHQRLSTTGKRYGLFVAIPVYIILISLTWSILKRIPGIEIFNMFLLEQLVAASPISII